MPWICTPDFSGSRAPGVKSGPWFHPDMWDEPVPLTVTRRRLDPGATDRIPLHGRENFGYVITGSGRRSPHLNPRGIGSPSPPRACCG